MSHLHLLSIKWPSNPISSSDLTLTFTRLLELTTFHIHICDCIMAHSNSITLIEHQMDFQPELYLGSNPSFLLEASSMPELTSIYYKHRAVLNFTSALCRTPLHVGSW